MTITKQEIGKLGENLATRYLSSVGYKILKRNFRDKYGEVDIIAECDNELVFIEVKARTSLKYGRPIDAVTRQKQMHILRTAQYYIFINKLEHKKIRFDVIEVYIIDGKYRIKHIKNAI